MGTKQKHELIERCLNETEKDLTITSNGLVPKFSPHERQPKWIAKFGTRDCKGLGKAKNYSFKLKFYMQVGTLEWLKQFEIKTNEPNSFAVPISQLVDFNSRIIMIEEIRVWKNKKK